MIVYSSVKSEFRQDVRDNRIEALILDAYQSNLGHSTSKSEIESWKNSMMYMSNIQEDEGILKNTGVAIDTGEGDALQICIFKIEGGTPLTYKL